jgi:hypothetical protein
MNIKYTIISLLAAAFVAQAESPAISSEVHGPYTVSTQSSAAVNIAVPQFDNDSDLLRVVIDVNFGANHVLTEQNLVSSTEHFTFTINDSILFSTPVEDLNYADSFSGQLDIFGYETKVFNLNWSPLVSSIVYDSNLDVWQGSSSINFVFDPSSSFSAGGNGNDNTSLSTTYKASITVTYQYVDCGCDDPDHDGDCEDDEHDGKKPKKPKKHNKRKKH